MYFLQTSDVDVFNVNMCDLQGSRAMNLSVSDKMQHTECLPAFLTAK